jgi:hypothetical protein
MDARVERWAAAFPATAAAYAIGAEVVRAGRPAETAHGLDAIAAAARDLRRELPDARLRIVRTVTAGATTAVEAVLSATPRTHGPRLAVPMAAWLDFDADGRLARETRYLEWQHARPEAPGTEGTVREGSGPARGQDWYRAYAHRLAALWSESGVRMADECYADDTVVESLWAGPGAAIRGIEPLRAAEARLMETLPAGHREMRVHRAIGEGRVIALEWTISGRIRGEGPLVGREGTLFLTLDDADRVISDRIYWDFAQARPLAD